MQYQWNSLLRCQAPQSQFQPHSSSEQSQSHQKLAPNQVQTLSEIDLMYLKHWKEKNWNNEYVDLNKLLFKRPVSNVQHNIVYHHGIIQVKPNYKDENITSISQWSAAFLSFASIYCVRHSTQAIHICICRYMATIRKAAERSPNPLNWKDYDIRLNKSVHSTLSWSSVDAELWIFYTEPTMLNYNPNSPKHFKCYSYNFHGICEKQTCRFLHVKCNGSHPSLIIGFPRIAMSNNSPRQSMLPINSALDTPRYQLALSLNKLWHLGHTTIITVNL